MRLKLGGYKMSEFKTIETQGQLDEIIGDRIARAKATEREAVKKEYEEKYKGYDDFKNQIDTLNNDKKSLEDTIAELQGNEEAFNTLKATNKKLETDALKVKIALQNGIPFDMANRLNGEDEESILKDAKTVSQYMKNSNTRTSPLRNPESKATTAGEESYKNLLKGLNIDE